MFTTVYPIIITVLLVAFVALFIVATRNHLKEIDRLELRLKEARETLGTQGYENRKLTQAHNELKVEYRVKLKDCDSLRETVERLREDLKELHKQLRDRRALTSIKFTANVPHLGWTKTEFSLGEGPCGKTVESLEFTEQVDRYVITQRCTDGERKTFEYMKGDVSGRIEKAYRAPEAQ